MPKLKFFSNDYNVFLKEVMTNYKTKLLVCEVLNKTSCPDFTCQFRLPVA